MKKLRIWSLLLCLIAVLFALPAAAQDASVTGFVLDPETGEGVEDAWVGVLSSGTPLASARTDVSGSFTISVPPGTGYEISVDYISYLGPVEAFFLDDDGGSGAAPGPDGQWIGGLTEDSAESTRIDMSAGDEINLSVSMSEVPIIPPSEVAVSGKVLDPGMGTGVDGAWVEVIFFDTHLDPVGKRTNASGEFSVTVPQGTDYSVRVEYVSDEGTISGYFTDNDGGTGDDPGSDTEWAGGVTEAQADATLLDVGPDGLSGLRIILGKSTTISGVVKDSAGSPVANVKVIAEPGVVGTRGMTLTDASGAFVISVTGGTYKLYADVSEIPDTILTSGYFKDDDSGTGLDPRGPDGEWTGNIVSAASSATSISVGASGVSDIAITLKDGVSISGVVKSEADGQPVPDVEVGVWVSGSSATTDASGAFSLTVPESEDYLIRIDTGESGFIGGYFMDADSGYGTDPGSDGLWAGSASGDWRDRTLIDLTAGDVNVEILLGKGATVGGTIVDESGAPVPDVQVCLNYGYGGGACSATDETGVFAATVLGGYNYHVLVITTDTAYVGGYFEDADGTAPWSGSVNEDYQKRSPVYVPPEGTLEMEIVLKSGVLISGIVVDESGAPVPDVQVWMEPASDEIEWFGDIQTDESGAFSAAVTEGYHYRIHVSTGRLQGSDLLGGYFQDDDNVAPWSGTVAFDKEYHDYGWNDSEEIPGTRIYVGPEGVSDIEIVLEKGVFFSGFVRNGSEPVPYASFTVSRFGGDYSSSYNWKSTDENGEFSIAVAAGYNYTLSVEAWPLDGGEFWDENPDDDIWSGGITQNSDLATVMYAGPEGVSGIEVDIALLPGVIVSGRVSDEEGHPVSGVSITFSPDTGSLYAYAGTDADGTYRVEVSPDVSYGIWVASWQGTVRDGYVNESGEAVPSDESIAGGGWNQTEFSFSFQEDTELDISVITTPTISGQVFGDGNTVGGVSVNPSEISDDYSYHNYSSYTDENGTYNTVVTPDSDYGVCASSSGQFLGNCFDGTVTVEDASVDGIDIYLPIAETLSGTISGLGQGKRAIITTRDPIHNANDYPYSSGWGYEEGWTEVIGTGDAEVPFTILYLEPESEHTLWVWAEGALGGYVEADGSVSPDTDQTPEHFTAGTDDIPIILEPGRTISGTVTGISPGDVIQIRAEEFRYYSSYYYGYNDIPWELDQIEVVADGSTAAFSVSGIPDDMQVTLWVGSENYLDGYYVGPDAERGEGALYPISVADGDVSGITIPMSPGVTISGTITGLEEGARVLLTPFTQWDYVPDHHHREIEVIGTGEAALAYEIKGLHPYYGYYIQAVSDRYADGYYAGAGNELAYVRDNAVHVSVMEDDVSGVDFSVLPGRSVSGNIIGIEADEWASISVQRQTEICYPCYPEPCEPDCRSEYREYASIRISGTGEDMPYVIRGLPHFDDWVIHLWTNSVSGYYSGTDGKFVETTDEAMSVSTATGDASGADLVLTESNTISGTITGLKRGENAYVQVSRSSDWYYAEEYVRGTGEPVEYRFRRLPEGNDFTVTFTSDNYPNQSQENIDSIASPDDIDFNLVPGKSISGSISGAEALQWITVSVVSPITGDVREKNVRTDAAGNAVYEIEGMGDAEDYVAYAKAGDELLYYVDENSWEVATALDLSGESLTGIDFNFGTAERYVISGSVAGLDDDTIQVRVYVWDEITGILGENKFPGNGRFFIEMPRGSYKIGISAEGYGDIFYDADTEDTTADRSGSTALALTQDTDIGEILLSTGHTLSGVVTGPDGEPMSGIMVEVYGNGVYTNAVTDESGAYEVTDLPNGTYSVTIENDAGGTYDGEITISDADEVLDILLGSVLSGTVSDSSFVTVKLFDDQGTLADEVAIEDGEYRFEGLNPGSYVVVVLTADEAVEKAFSVIVGYSESTLNFR